MQWKRYLITVGGIILAYCVQLGLRFSITTLLQASHSPLLADETWAIHIISSIFCLFFLLLYFIVWGIYSLLPK